MSANPRRSRPRLVDPDLAARVPGLRPVAATAVALAVLSAAAIIVQAVALASVVDRSLLHHASLRAVTPALVVLGLAILVRAVLHGAGDLSALRAADRVVATLRRQLLEHALALGPGWLGAERPGELSLTATRGLRSLHTYYAALPAPGGRGRRHSGDPAGLGGHAGLAGLRGGHRPGAGSARDDDRLRPGSDQAVRAPVAPAELARRSGPAARRRAPHPARLRSRVAGTPRGGGGDRRRAVRHHAHAPCRLPVRALHGHDRRLRRRVRRHGARAPPAVGRARPADRHGRPPRRARDLHPDAPRRGRVPRQHRRAGCGGAGRRGARDARPVRWTRADVGTAGPAAAPCRCRCRCRCRCLDGRRSRRALRAPGARGTRWCLLPGPTRDAPGPDGAVGTGQVDGAGGAVALRRAERGHHGVRPAAQQRPGPSRPGAVTSRGCRSGRISSTPRWPRTSGWAPPTRPTRTCAGCWRPWVSPTCWPTCPPGS